MHRHSVFVTLTYKDAPDEVSKRDLQLFFKRLRARLGVGFRYFAVGEYGGRGGRPHYHVALFGVSFAEADDIGESWDRGFVQVGELNARSAHYIAGYVQKKLMNAVPEGKLPEFALMSLKPGIGGLAAGKIADAVKSLIHSGRLADVPPSIRHERSLYGMGRYLRNRARVAVGLDARTPQSGLAELAAKYASEDSEVRERKRVNGYVSARVRFEISKTKEKL